jgi:S-adenosylmethionine synthetase
MKPHHVNSKQHLLSNNDILLVAAHDHPESAKEHYKNAGSPKQINAQMLLFTIFSKLFTQQNVIRLREGNTLFTITAGEKGALFMMFDADTPNNTINNITVTCEAARKMGFKKLVAPVENEMVKKMSKRAFEKNKKAGDKYNVDGDFVILEFGNGSGRTKNS